MTLNNEIQKRLKSKSWTHNIANKIEIKQLRKRQKKENLFLSFSLVLCIFFASLLTFGIEFNVIQADKETISHKSIDIFVADSSYWIERSFQELYSLESLP